MLEEQVYIADAAIATALYLSMALGKPLLIEGPAGVGKTEIAKALASALDTKLIRLQCYEGLDATTALYEWNYPKQLLHLKLEESSSASEAEKEAMIFSEAFLLKRPLLQAITEHERAPVLLIDEIDRSDEEFEAFLLEVLSDFQVTIPEIGIDQGHSPAARGVDFQSFTRSVRCAADDAVSITGLTIRHSKKNSRSCARRFRQSERPALQSASHKSCR